MSIIDSLEGQSDGLAFCIEVEAVGSEDKTYHFEVTAAIRGVEAERLGLLAIDCLQFDASVSGDGGGVSLRVHFTADVVQSCVVTLDPVRSRIDEGIELCYAPSEEAHLGAKGSFVDPLKENGPEPLVNGSIDVGRVVMEHLLLALDPYPRRSGAKFKFQDSFDDSSTSPFALLSIKKETESS